MIVLILSVSCFVQDSIECENKIQLETLDPDGRPCYEHCECNNLKFTGRCIPFVKNDKRGRCFSIPRLPCLSKGKIQECEVSDNVTKGICRKGVQICQDEPLTELLWGDCSPGDEKSKENCNGKDDDCDGYVDTKWDEKTQSQRPLTQPCPDILDPKICYKGTKTCKNGSWSDCMDIGWKKKETCNGKDDDCDGKIDENLRQACEPPIWKDRANIGICRLGLAFCEGGKWVCKGRVPPKIDDDCNDTLDNNCDGNTNEGCQTCLPSKWLKVFPSLSSEISSLDFYHLTGGNVLFVGTKNGKVYLYKRSTSIATRWIKRAEPILTFSILPHKPIKQIQSFPSYHAILLLRDKRFSLYKTTSIPLWESLGSNISNLREAQFLEEPDEEPLSFVLHPQNSLFAYITNKQHIKIAFIADNQIKVLQTISTSKLGRIVKIFYSQGGNYLFAQNDSHTIYIWDTVSGELYQKWNQLFKMDTLETNHTKEYLAYSSETFKISLLNLNNFKNILNIQDNRKIIDLAFNYNTYHLSDLIMASSYTNGDIKLWRTETMNQKKMKMLTTLQGKGVPSTHLNFSNNQKTFVAVRGKRLEVWECPEKR